MTRGERMVCDLQGAFDPVQNSIGLTDPCILSKQAPTGAQSTERLSLSPARHFHRERERIELYDYYDYYFGEFWGDRVSILREEND